MKLYTREDLSIQENSLTYNDIGLVPTHLSFIQSRKEVSTETTFLGRKISLPVISSPMDTVSGEQMCNFLHSKDCMGIPARLNNKDGFNKLQKILTINAKFDKFEQLYELGDEVEIVCVDTANAGNSYLHCWIREFRKMFPNIKIIMGNTVSPRTLKLLDDIGINAVRVGIGSGSMCSTSIQTGIGIGQVSAISECVKFKKRNGLKIQIIADGGIRTTGDICKAMALGADVVMVGRMFAGTEESPGEVIKHNEKKYKVYRGSASYAVKIDKKFIEGEETLVEYKGSVEKILWEIKDGLRSCMSYLGVDSIEELRNEEVLFSILSINSYLERLPYFENK